MYICCRCHFYTIMSIFYSLYARFLHSYYYSYSFLFRCLLNLFISLFINSFCLFHSMYWQYRKRWEINNSHQTYPELYILKTYHCCSTKGLQNINWLTENNEVNELTKVIIDSNLLSYVTSIEICYLLQFY